MNILIPAYKPNENMVELAQTLLNEGYEVMVVNDGSGEGFEEIFGKLDSKVVQLKHEINRGKGRAMKTGFEYILKNYPKSEGVITVDADGQHLPEDIEKVKKKMLEKPEKIIIGSRLFKGDVPLRSRFGNTITKFVFAVVSGLRLNDTQTGLRGIPYSRIKEMLELEGERYEYEMNMLMYIARKKMPISEVFIETVYIEDNASSHFNTVKDSIKIYKIIFKYLFKRN